MHFFKVHYIEKVNKVLDEWEKKEKVTGIFIDLQKTFDRID